jgi:hypothetical protein
MSVIDPFRDGFFHDGFFHRHNDHGSEYFGATRLIIPADLLSMSQPPEAGRRPAAFGPDVMLAK